MASERADDMKDAPNGGSDASYRSPADQGRFYYMGTPDNLLGSRPTPRRTKRHVADGDKDNKYWEKRKRNNDAARRSRETKRRMDMDVRSRVLLLEEELSLVRKELTVIKVKFGLPMDQRFLSTDDNGQLVPTPAIPLPHMSPMSPMSPPMSSNMSHGGMTSDGMPSVNSYSMPTSTAGRDETSDNRRLDSQLGRPTSTDSRHNVAPHINTQLEHLGPESQTSPSDNMPVKKRRRGRKEWEESEDQVAEIAEAATGSGEAYYGRMLAGSPYPGLLWPNTAPGAQTQFPFPSQMPMMGPAAYQVLMDEQQRLPSINAFSSVPVSVKSEQSQEQAAQQQQQSHHQQQHVHQQQQHTQQQQQPQGHTNGTRSDTTTPDDFEYLGSNAGHPLPRYYVPYTEGDDATSSRPAPSLTPADLSITKGRHQSLELPELSLSKGRHQSLELADINLAKGRHQSLELPELSLSKGRHQSLELAELSLSKGRHQSLELAELSLSKGRHQSLELADLNLAKGRHQSLELPVSEVGDQPTRSTHHQQIGVVQPMKGNQQPLQQPQHPPQQQPQQQQPPQQQPQQQQQQQQQHQQQQHQQQQHQQQHLQRSISSGSEEDEQQERLLVENSDIRNRLQQLTAEVAKMKDYVLKDNVRSNTSGEDQ